MSLDAKIFTCTAGQIRAQEFADLYVFIFRFIFLRGAIAKHTRTRQQRRAILQLQHQRTTSVPVHTTSPSTHRQVPCHPTAGLLASEQKQCHSTATGVGNWVLTWRLES